MGALRVAPPPPPFAFRKVPSPADAREDFRRGSVAAGDVVVVRLFALLLGGVVAVDRFHHDTARFLAVAPGADAHPLLLLQVLIVGEEVFDLFEDDLRQIVLFPDVRIIGEARHQKLVESGFAGASLLEARIAGTAVIVDGDFAITRPALDQQLDRLLRGLCRDDRRLQHVAAIGGAVDCLNDGADVHARLERRAVPDHCGRLAVLGHRQTDRIGDVHAAAFLGVGEVFRRFGGVDELVAVHREAIDRRGLARLGQALGEEACPVIGDDGVQRVGDVVERVGDLTPVAVADAEEGLGEIVDRLGATRLLAEHRIDFHPDHQAFVVIVFAALPAGPALRAARRDDGIVGGIDQVAPLARRGKIIAAGDAGIGVQRVLLADEARARL
ncbi:hypothetical protein WR25_13351 [Diploscapter pachys]|uniref:Uncharacterized protein n=1 Tax=Diploscapter pachys TaxID=2018661 RepID=A0A2A2K2P6_9BILA|nr:hypothetical protein WR25_13351 [Diploscapter pachys]